MSETYVIGSLNGALVASVVFGGFAVLLGVGVTAVLRRLAAPEGTMSYLGTTPLARRSFGVVGSTVLLALVWYWLWSGFYTLELRGDSVILTYAMPRRQRSVAVSDIATVRWRAGPRNSRFLVLDMRFGRELRSAHASLRAAEGDELTYRLTEARARARR